VALLKSSVSDTTGATTASVEDLRTDIEHESLDNMPLAVCEIQRVSTRIPFVSVCLC
jgi:hypothetical protein